jgi:SNF2 family DNA or RNA helicase
VTAGTIEEKIFQRQLTKQGLGGGILDPERSGGSQQFHFSSGKSIFFRKQVNIV